MAFQTRQQLKTKISELEAKIEIYEMAIANAGLSVLKKGEEEKEEFGFHPKKEAK